MDAMLYKLLSALSQGLAFAFFTVGVAIAFRWIKFPDLTGDGSFTLGGVITARLVALGAPVWAAMPVAIAAGFLAGVGTFAMNRYLRVPKILAGVLMMMGLYTVNLRILGQPNLQLSRQDSLLGMLPESFGAQWAFSVFLLFVCLVVVGFSILYVLLESRSGLLLRVGGANPKMATIQGIPPGRLFWGLGLANALVAMSGALIAQRSYNADVHMGTGQIIVAVAALFIGMVLFRGASTRHLLAASLVGSVLYMLLMQVALEAGVAAQDFRLISTLIVLAAIVVAARRGGQAGLRKGADAFGIDV
jgi:putative ABC transport system permease protein